tara:strand:- start:21 stop:167 length:147 start_codon:yes stop_codon:yes gene_type:complete
LKAALACHGGFCHLWKQPVEKPPSEMMAKFDPAYGGKIAPARPGEGQT